jgi:Inosine-uridine preferring nucleoside hydrolase
MRHAFRDAAASGTGGAMRTIGRGRRGRFVLVAAVVAAVTATVPTSGSAASVSRGAGSKEGKGVPRVIIDTDLSRWWDDATTIGLANVLHDQGKLRILGVISNVPNAVAVAALDAINTAYGHGDIPLGAVAGSDADSFQHGYTDEVVQRLPNSVDDHTDVPNAVTLYRRLLAKQPDKSVTIISVGGYTNLAGLLASKRGQGSSLGGRALVEDKVKRLVQMDGIFPGGGPAFTNQKIDLAAATAVVGGEGWPTPIAWVDGLGGVQTMVGGTLCATEKAKHPMRVVYEVLFACGPPGDGNWDAPTLLYAVGDVQSVFSEQGQGGAAVINAQGGLSWETPSSRPNDLYVKVTDQQTLNQRIDELLAVG